MYDNHDGDAIGFAAEKYRDNPEYREELLRVAELLDGWANPERSLVTACAVEG